jgi:hypothetical protein
LQPLIVRTTFRRMKIVLSLLICLSLTGCQPTATPSVELKNLRADVNRLEAQHTALTHTLHQILTTQTNLAADLSIQDVFSTLTASNYNRRLLNLEINRGFTPGVVLDASKESTYQPLETAVGKIFIVCKESTPYLDGYKVKVSIGNPLACQLNGLTIKAIAGTNKVQTFSFLEDFNSGTWTDLQMTFSPASASDMKDITTWAETSRLTLATPRPR